METRIIFNNISPIDHRYSISESDLFNKLSLWLSETASINACVKAEIALLIAHLEIRKSLTPSLREKLENITASVSAQEVYEEEEKTQHHIRALVNVLNKKVPSEIAHLVHLGATSVDILDTAFSFRIKGASKEIVIPLLQKLEILLCDFVDKEAETPQVGRTHGQHAVPITLGFAFAEYVSRLGKSIIEIMRLSCNLKGKLSGAVGAYNATSLMFSDPEKLEKLYLNELGLEPSEYSTQLVEPEYLLRLLLEYNIAFGIIANLADDLRNLQRSEIGEVREKFSENQVGSSTMPHKRNPWNSEHVKSLWKAFMPRVTTFFMDQISEHQRDLTNSASQRFIADYITGFCLAVNRMISIIEGLGADRKRLLTNLKSGEGAVMAENAYILLAESGVSGAHEIIRKLTLKCENENISFAKALSEESIFNVIAEKLLELKIINKKEDAFSFFEYPEKYSGLSAKKAKAISLKYRKIMEEGENYTQY